MYEGSWKKGLRHGKGNVTIRENGKEVKSSWLWDNDVRQKEILPPPYKIITERNISRPRVNKQGEGTYGWFYPNSLGGVFNDFEDFQLAGSSGSEIKQSQKIGFDNVVFPFELIQV